MAPCNRDLHRARYMRMCTARIRKIRKISATSNVQLPRFRLDELVKNNLLSLKHQINRLYIYIRN